MDFVKYSNTKFQQMDRRTGGQMDRQTELMNLIVAFHGFVNVPNKQVKHHLVQV